MSPAYDIRPATRVESLLAALRGETIFFCPNPGNAGDSMIAVATFQMFRRLGLRVRVIEHRERTRDLSGATLIYGGGGNFVPEYSQARFFLEAHHAQVRRLIVLPHTIRGHEDLLAEFGDNVDLVTRERDSFAHVSNHAGKARVHLMDDLALDLDMADARRGPLRPSPVTLRQGAKLARHFWRRARMAPLPEGPALDCFRGDREQAGGPPPAGNLDLPAVFNAGVAPELVARLILRHQLAILDRYEEIRTNRLHTCIAGLLLGKRVAFHDNSYGKNRAVCEASLAGRFDALTWVGNMIPASAA